MGGEVVEFSSLQTERIRAQVELDFALRSLAEKAEQLAEMKRSHVSDDRGILRKFGDLAGIGDGILKISGSVDEF